MKYKAEKVLLVLFLSMLFASAAMAAFFGIPPPGSIFPKGPAATVSTEDAAFTGSVVVDISNGSAIGARALVGEFAPEGCKPTQVCLDAQELLSNLGTAHFVLDKGKNLRLAEQAAH